MFLHILHNHTFFHAKKKARAEIKKITASFGKEITVILRKKDACLKKVTLKFTSNLQRIYDGQNGSDFTRNLKKKGVLTVKMEKPLNCHAKN